VLALSRPGQDVGWDQCHSTSRPLPTRLSAAPAPPRASPSTPAERADCYPHPPPPHLHACTAFLRLLAWRCYIWGRRFGLRWAEGRNCLRVLRQAFENARVPQPLTPHLPWAEQTLPWRV